MDNKADEIWAAAEECLGTPWRHQGRTCGTAIDCVGVVAHIMDRLSLPYDDVKGYPRSPFDGRLQQVLADQPSLEQIGQLEDGCVVALRITKEPQHVGVYYGGQIIHASYSAANTLKQTFSAKFVRSTQAIYRIIH